jgi:hypothetical protein
MGGGATAFLCLQSRERAAHDVAAPTSAAPCVTILLLLIILSSSVAIESVVSIVLGPEEHYVHCMAGLLVTTFSMAQQEIERDVERRA